MAWTIVSGDSIAVAIHAALLPSDGDERGVVLLFGGDEHDEAQGGHDGDPADPAKIDHTCVHTINGDGTNTVTPISSPTTDVFCAGHAFLGDGRLVIGGGTESWGANDPGEPAGGEGGGHVHGLGNFGGHQGCWVFNYKSKTWARIADFNFRTGQGEGGGRWYPTLNSLPSGDLIAFSGHPSRRSRNFHNNNIPEIYSMATGQWNLLTAHPDMTFYPRVLQIPGNKLFLATGIGGANSRIFDLNTGTLTPTVIARTASAADGIYDGWDNTAVLLPLLPSDNYAARVLMANGAQPVKINLNDLASGWTNAGARAINSVRKFACSTILPNGKILVNGGTSAGNNSDAGCVRDAEIYEPGIDWGTGNYGGAEVWTAGDLATVNRNYHATALLLPDGSVWTAGSSKNAASGDADLVAERRIEVYYPSYYADAARPVISAAPKSLGYHHGQFTMRSPQAAGIRRVALIRCGSCTHAGNFDQRYVALGFQHEGGDVLRVNYPTDASVLPPGYYMLWVVDAAGLPCQRAKFVRVAHQNCHYNLDHDKFSSEEVQAVLAGGAVAEFPRSFYIVYDGYLDSELPGMPTISARFDSETGPVVPGMEFSVESRLLENPAFPQERAQRVTYQVGVRFRGAGAFSAANLPGTDRPVVITADVQGHECRAGILLTKNPNPYMTDGPVEWLSTDVRVFQIREGDPMATITHGASPTDFIRDLLARFRSVASDEYHPFFDISRDIQTSRLELATSVNGKRVFNYAIAKVRYRAVTTTAAGVKVFFRIFNAATTDTVFDDSTKYRRAGTGANAVPLLGRTGSTIMSIPFFGVPRVNSAAQSMAAQPPDTLNTRDLAPNGAAERIEYFGVWLDINQPDPQIPIHPANDGPFTTGDFSVANLTGRAPIQCLIRGMHPCLVAEIRYDLDPISTGATPGGNDNLSQRNLVTDYSDNPGGQDSHRVMHTLEIKPSGGKKFVPPTYSGGFDFAKAYVTSERYSRPDELIISRKNLPTEAEIEFFIPDTTAEEILDLQTFSRLTTSDLAKTDDRTILIKGGGEIAYIPLPNNRTINLAALMTIQLPPGVVAGTTYSVDVQQVDGRTQRIIGSFRFEIPVGTSTIVLPWASKQLSLLKWIQQAIPPTDRWFPVFERYIRQVGEKVADLGGNPEAIEPSPNGDGKTPVAVAPSNLTCLTLHWGAAILLAMLLLSLGILSFPSSLLFLTLFVGAFVAFLCVWKIRCKTTACDFRKILLTGLLLATAVLSLALLYGREQTAYFVPVLVFSAIAAAVLGIYSVCKSCDCEK